MDVTHAADLYAQGGSKDIVGAELHEILWDLTLGKRPEVIAQEREIAFQTVYGIRHRNKDRIAAILADWTNKFADLKTIQKHNRMADLEYLRDQLIAQITELYADAEAATETMRTVDPNAARVWPPLKEVQPLRRELARLLDQIETSMGQHASHIGQVAGPEVGTSTRLAVMGLGADKSVPNPVQPQQLPEPVSDDPMGELRRKWDRDAARRRGEEPVSEPFPKFGWVQDRPDDGSWRERLRAERQQHEARQPEIQADNQAYYESLTGTEYEKHLEEQAKGYRDRLVNDDGFRWEAAGVLALPDAGHEVVKGLRDRLATDDHFRWQVAEGMIPIDWARLPSYGDDEGDEQQHGPAPVTAPEPAPVAVDEHQKETGVQLPYRVNPPVVEPEPEPEAVVEEPEPEPEVPPVYPEIADTARVLATQVWTSGSMLRSRFYSGKIPHLCDQYLSHAQAMGWLAVDADDRIVKGQVDPRPVAVTRIPNF